MDYYKYEINTSAQNAEILLAFLGELPFDSFEEKHYGLDAYLPAALAEKSLEERLAELQKTLSFSFQKKLLKAQNWNKLWESNFEPIVVDGFCAIRAAFHEPIPGTLYEIVITPKMAFGTGHHATTMMMLESMKNIDFQNKQVFDFGCGTGILAILASKLGARSVKALDIEQESYENAIENARENAVENIEVVHGTLEKIDSLEFDIILANINRNVILDSLGSLYEKLSENGKLIVSGFLKQDETILLKEASDSGFFHQTTLIKNNWLCCHFDK